jgi:hypothetical protein
MSVYRWRGVSPRGKQQFGTTNWPDLSAVVEAMFKRGWRSQIVRTGRGPVPPPAAGADALAAAIEPELVSGRRTWWASSEPTRPGIARPRSEAVE